MPWFITAYPCHNKLPDIVQTGSYGSNLWARDLQDAFEVARQRGAGEVIVSNGSVRPLDQVNVASMIRRRRGWKHVLHAATFMCWHAMRAGVATPDEVIGDGGLLHGIAHAMNAVREPRQRERLAELAEHIESRVPGWRAPEKG